MKARGEHTGGLRWLGSVAATMPEGTGRRQGVEGGEPAALASVRRIVLQNLRGVPCRVYLFGSFARQTAQGYSDIDVAIAPTHPLPLTLLARVREALEESSVPYEVDLVDLSRASAALREAVEQEGVLWTE